MKRVRKSSLRRTVESLQLGNYIRQLSIVVLGVVITFVGSDLVTYNAKQREVKIVMQLIKEEIKNNSERLLRIKENVVNMDNLSTTVRERNFNFDGISQDTIRDFYMTINSMRKFGYSDNAMNMMSNSSLMQYISDKSFLLTLIQTYESIRHIDAVINVYYDRRTKLWEHITGSLTESQAKMVLHGSSYDRLNLIFSFAEAKKHLYYIEGSFQDGVFDEMVAQFNSVILTIEQKYE